MTPSRIVSNCAVLLLACSTLAFSQAAKEQPATSGKQLTPAQQKLQTFNTMFVYSDTVYLDSEVLRTALMKRFEIGAWKITLRDEKTADVRIKVWRPTFTFDWRYRIADSATNQELASGRIVAWDGKRAADSLAEDIARTIGRVRTLPLHLVAALADEPNARKWQLKYQSGSEGPRRGVELTLAVSPEHIVARQQNRVVFVIPAQAISGVAYNPVMTNVYKGWEAFSDSASGPVSDDPNAMANALMLIPVVAVGDTAKQEDRGEHLCQIAWVDGGAVRNVELKAETAKAVEEFLAAVQEVSHRKALDMQTEADALRQAIEREDAAGRAISVQLDKKTAVGWRVLEPGAFRVIVLERSRKGSVAYFLKAEASLPHGIVAQMPVVVEPGMPQATAARVSYGDANGVASLHEIATADKTLRFQAVPLQLAAEPQVSQDMENLLAEAALKPKYRTIQVKSDTVYLKNAVMEKALAEHPAFAQWNMKVLPPEARAELLLVVKRPLLTFTWTYVLTDLETGEKLADDKVTARDGGKAAITLADQVVNALRAKAAREMKNELN